MPPTAAYAVHVEGGSRTTEAVRLAKEGIPAEEHGQVALL